MGGRIDNEIAGFLLRRHFKGKISWRLGFNQGHNRGISHSREHEVEKEVVRKEDGRMAKNFRGGKGKQRCIRIEERIISGKIGTRGRDGGKTGFVLDATRGKTARTMVNTLKSKVLYGETFHKVYPILFEERRAKQVRRVIRNRIWPRASVVAERMNSTYLESSKGRRTTREIENFWAFGSRVP